MSMQVAQTILSHLGGNRFVVMTGAKHFTGGENTLSFQISARNPKRIIGALIALEPDDTYTITFLRRAKPDPDLKISVGVEEASSHSDVYVEDLARLFTEVTGLETKLY